MAPSHAEGVVDVVCAKADAAKGWSSQGWKQLQEGRRDGTNRCQANVMHCLLHWEKEESGPFPSVIIRNGPLSESHTALLKSDGTLLPLLLTVHTIWQLVCCTCFQKKRLL